MCTEDEPATPAPASPVKRTNDVVYQALEQLFASGQVDDAKRQQLKKAAFQASDRQYNVLTHALTEYLTTTDHLKALEWVDAFLASL